MMTEVQGVEISERLISLEELRQTVDVFAGFARLDLAKLFGDAVVVDELGRPCVAWSTAVAHAERVRDKAAVREAEQKIRLGRLSRQRVSAGVPAQEGMTAFESMAAAGDYVTPRDESGNPRPNFLDDELAAGRQHQAQVKAAAAERKGRK